MIASGYKNYPPNALSALSYYLNFSFFTFFLSIKLLYFILVTNRILYTYFSLANQNKVFDFS